MDLKLVKQILDFETHFDTCSCININGGWIFFDDYQITYYQDDNSECYRIYLTLNDKTVFIIYLEDIINIKRL